MRLIKYELYKPDPIPYPKNITITKSWRCPA